MKNNKGYTMVELLATIVIISILSVGAFIAYTSYKDYARRKAYDTMAKSAANAASEYAMEHYGVKSVKFKTLTENEYLEYPADPSNSAKMCSGIVYIKTDKESSNIDNLAEDEYVREKGLLEKESYDVVICCANYSYIYHFPGGTKKEIKTKKKTDDTPTSTEPTDNNEQTENNEPTENGETGDNGDSSETDEAIDVGGPSDTSETGNSGDTSNNDSTQTTPTEENPLDSITCPIE